MSSISGSMTQAIRSSPRRTDPKCPCSATVNLAERESAGSLPPRGRHSPFNSSLLTPNISQRHHLKDTQSLQDLLHNRIFRVPDYRRGYAWDEQQVGEFLDDLDLLDATRYHYTGTSVLHQPSDGKPMMDNEGNSYVETDIVDGQQRLTTIVLLIDKDVTYL